MSRLNSSLIRQINTARVFHALRTHPRSSQRALCLLTGLDASTVSTVITGLEERGLVRRISGRRSGLAGRPETLSQIDDDAGVLIGIAIERGWTRLIACTLSGRPLETARVETGRSVGTAIKRVRAGVDALLGRLDMTMDQVFGVGVGQHGLVSRDGRLIFAPRLGWRDVELLALLRAAFPVPVYLENDTKAVAVAEHMFGSCQDVRNFVVLHGASGLGGALYIDGALHHGAGLAGELGHMKVVPGGALCGCGGHGCLEAYVSEPALIARLSAIDPALRSTADIAERAASRPDIASVLEEAGTLLGLAVANLVNLLSPSRVVLAGDLATLSPWLLPAVSAAVRTNALPAMHDSVTIAVSSLGANAAELGGVGLAMAGFQPLSVGRSLDRLS